MRARFLAVLAVAMLGMGCASTLKVDVDVYNGPRLNPVGQARAAALAVIQSERLEPASLLAAKQAFEAEAEAVATEAYSRFFTDAAATQAAVASLRLWLPVEVNTAWVPVVQAAEAARSTVEDLLVRTSVSGGLDVDGGILEQQRLLYAQVRSFNSALDGFVMSFSRAFNARFAQPTHLALDVSGSKVNPARAIATQSAFENGRLVGYPIFDPSIGDLDRLDTFTDANGAQRPTWVPFVRTKAHARGGNAQFVMVREGLVVFNQKSLDFDPTPVIGAGTAVARLGLRVGAALATGRVPMGVGATPGAEPAPAADGAGADSGGTVVDTSSIEGDRLTLERRRRARAALLFDLADLYDAVAKTPADADKLQEKFKSTIRTYQARVQPMEGEK